MANKRHIKTARDNRANQLNREHPEYHRSRGASPEKAVKLADLARTNGEKEVQQ